jgi:DNA mismatch endonuclease (patch repair protein)
MADVVSKEKRSAMMAGIRSKNTKPEIAIRKALHEMGYRYRLHARNLPGTPDLVFPKYKTAVFVHGCFWHRHGCHLFRWPSTRREFWETKINGNAERDCIHQTRLIESGWKIVIIWECALKGRGRLPLEKITNSATDMFHSQSAKMIEIAGLQ